MSLKSQIENLAPGESFITKNTRTGIYVAAKRAGVEISTEVVDTGIKVTRKTTYEKMVEAISLVDQIVALPVADRLALFENFELCCGMNRGECVCLREADLTATVLSPPVLSGETLRPKRKLSLDELRDLMANPIPAGTPLTDLYPDGMVVNGAGKILTEPVVEDWRFTKDAPQFADDGNVYRKQVLAPAGKKMRTVRVDADDHELIL